MLVVQKEGEGKGRELSLKANRHIRQGSPGNVIRAAVGLVVGGLGYLLLDKTARGLAEGDDMRETT